MTEKTHECTRIVLQAKCNGEQACKQWQLISCLLKIYLYDVAILRTVLILMHICAQRTNFSLASHEDCMQLQHQEQPATTQHLLVSTYFVIFFLSFYLFCLFLLLVLLIWFQVVRLTAHMI